MHPRQNATKERQKVTIRDLFCVFKMGHELVTEEYPIMTIFWDHMRK